MPSPTSTPASIISSAIESLTRAADAALSKSEERTRTELARALSEARQARNQRDDALSSLKAIENEQDNHKKTLETWKASLDQADLTIQNQADTIAQLRQENIRWKNQYARVEKSCQEWKEQFMRVEQERIRLLAKSEHCMAQRDRDPGNVSGSSLDQYTHYSNTKSPSSSTSTKIGTAPAEKPSTSRRRLEPVLKPDIDRPQGTRKSTGKPSAGGTKVQTKTVTKTSRSAKSKDIPNQKPLQNLEGSASKAPIQRVIRRVHATVEVPIKVEDEEELVHDLVNDRIGRVPSDKNIKSSTTLKKVTRLTEPSQTENETSYMDGDVTPPAPGPLPRQRKSGTDPDLAAYRSRSQKEVNVRHRPPPRRKSIRELKESDFEYREDEEEAGEESDTDELNIGHGDYLEEPTKHQRANEKSSLPARRTGQKRKAADAMDVDEPVVSGRGAGKAVKRR